MRSIMVALEVYRLDHGVYPAWSADLESNVNGFILKSNTRLADVPTFRIRNGDETFAMLTTPVAYLPIHYEDHYSPVKAATFGYWTPPEADDWIIWSAGPDGDYDLTMENLPRLFAADSVTSPTPFVHVTYDPTNGAISNGDLWLRHDPSLFDMKDLPTTGTLALDMAQIR